MLCVVRICSHYITRVQKNNNNSTQNTSQKKEEKEEEHERERTFFLRTMAKMKTTRKNKMNEVKGNKSTVTICTAKVLYVQVKQRNGETE